MTSINVRYAHHLDLYKSIGKLFIRKSLADTVLSVGVDLTTLSSGNTASHL